MRLFFPLNKGVVYGIVLILLVALIFLIKIIFSPTNNSPATNTSISTSTSASKTADLTPTQKATDSCAQFTSVKGEISCEEAKSIAINKLPGKVLNIEKKDVTLSDSDEASNSYKLWLITIKSDVPVEGSYNTSIVGVNVADGKIKYWNLQ